MNWNKIKDKRPKAFALLGISRGYPPPSNMSDYECGTVFEGQRLLYDFFDEQKIYVIVELEVQYTRELDEDGTNPHYVPDGFYYLIHDERQLAASGMKVYKDRSEAEADAFTDAFEILEEKLTE